MTTANETIKKVLDHFESKIGTGGVIKSWNDGNGNWYRKYADGWIEQGGITQPTISEWITLHTQMESNNYSISLLADNNLCVCNVFDQSTYPFETTRFKPWCWNSSGNQKAIKIRWIVQGY